MAREQQHQANQVFGESQDMFKNAQGKAGDLYGELFPAYKGMATNPQGFDPATKAAINTASQQSAGGSQAGAVGQGNLLAARTRNAGALAPALDESARGASRDLGNRALETEAADANLKEQHREQGLRGEQGLFNTENSNEFGSLGTGLGAVNANVNAQKTGWFQNMIDYMNAASNASKGAAALGAHAG